MGLDDRTQDFWSELRSLREEYKNEDSTMSIKQYLRREAYLREKYLRPIREGD